MNNYLRLTLAPIFLSTILYGQGITKEEIIKYKIKSITAIDENEIVKSVQYFNDNGEVVRIDDNDEKTRKEFVYDSNRLLIEEKIYSAGDGVHKTMKFLYDETNQLLKRELFTNGTVTETWIYEYDQNGNRIRESETMGGVTVFKYKGTQLIEEEIAKVYGKEETTTYKYKKNGQLSEARTKFHQTNTTYTMKFFYDEKKKIIKISTRQMTDSHLVAISNKQKIMALHILKAIYASPNKGVDVTLECTQWVIDANKTSIFIDPSTFHIPDPDFGVTKSFTVEYVINNQKKYKGGVDGNTLTLN